MVYTPINVPFSTLNNLTLLHFGLLEDLTLREQLCSIAKLVEMINHD